MKSAILILLISITAASLFAGGIEESSPGPIENASIRIYVSILPQSYFAERITGDLAEINVLVPPGRSPATYDPTPKQVSRLGGADLFFTIGVPFEQAFLPSLRGNMPNLRIVDTAEGIRRRLIQSEVEMKEDDHHEDDDHGHEEGMPDPHIWLSPPLVEEQAKNMLQALISFAPQHEATFRENYENFIDDLEELDRDLHTILKPVKGSPILVYHPSFGYFAENYGLSQIPIELGGKEPSPRELQEIISVAREKGVKVLFVQPEFSKTSARRVAEAINGVVVEVAPLKPNYLENMRTIVEEIRKGLSSE